LSERDGFLHVLTAIANKAEGIGKVERSGCNQRGILAQAVAGHEGRINSGTVEYAVRGNGNGEQGRLSNFRFEQFFLRTFKAELGQGIAEGIIGLFKGLAGYWFLFGKVSAHAGLLRTLTWK
jgi:hypothetical protein